MSQTKIIKAFVTQVLLVLSLLPVVCSGCSSSLNRSSRIEREAKDSSFLALIRQITERLDSETNTNLHHTQNEIRTIITFDTDKPADPSTGLPPISSVETKGSTSELAKHKQEKLSYQKNDSLGLEENSGSEESYQESDEKQKEVEVGKDISKAISIEIIILVIVISIIIIIYVRSHSSKQSN